LKEGGGEAKKERSLLYPRKERKGRFLYPTPRAARARKKKEGERKGKKLAFPI